MLNNNDDSPDTDGPCEHGTPQDSYCPICNFTSEIKTLLAELRAARAVDGREAAWLVERAGQWFCGDLYTEYEEKQAALPDLWRHNWSADPNRAMRFARKQDAETYIRHYGWGAAKATEHVWIDKALQHHDAVLAEQQQMGEAVDAVKERLLFDTCANCGDMATYMVRDRAGFRVDTYCDYHATKRVYELNSNPTPTPSGGTEGDG